MALTHTSAEASRRRRVRNFIVSGMACLVVGILAGYSIALWCDSLW